MFSFTCSTCGQHHEGAPSLSFLAPHYYYDVPEAERERRTLLDEDFCVIDNQHYFVRGCLQVPILGLDEPFLWGVWSTLSQPSFKRYVETIGSSEQQGKYFGWFSSRLPSYPDTLEIKTWVHPQAGGARPLLELENSDHPLCVDSHHGISIERARELYEGSLHAAGL